MMDAMWMGVTEPMADPKPAPGATWRAMLRAAADVVLPPVCVVCRTPVASHGLLCGPCFAGIDFIAPPLCARLGVPLPYDAGEPSLSAAAIAAPPAYDRARAVARYTQTMRDLIQGFKYRDRQEGLRLFSRWLARAGSELLEGARLSSVPVPLYRSRLWSRRFNQSALLAQGLERLTRRRADCFVLRRVRRTASQVGLSAAQRKRNVAGAFKVSPARAGDVAGKAIVVVDDVITTGATVEACARV
ncbi:ComF family protein [Methyloceanibacter methanicus]|uniref:ComF family protein n=1 Tax=Methyloceanibacter methanicus TaxID=1774968 RepID=UPI000AF92D53|nr:ComF family protein [Methyloceanibacter methanicus]